MGNIEACEVLQMPNKLTPIISEFNNFRYFLAEGGRGGGKTQGIARLLCYIAEKRTVRIFCGRETQNTIEESVYTVFKDVITNYQLNFKVFKDRIEHKTTHSQIRFKGFKEQGSVNIKGMEGVDILWIDEAQAISQNTLDIIIPTIRKQKAKVFFTMNRHLKTDPVYTQFHEDENCLHININYDDNPFISKALLDEAIKCKKDRPEDYEHIWGGRPLATADNLLFNVEALEACLTREFPHDSSKYHGRILGGDVARFGSNYSAGLILKQCGPNHWEEEYLERWKNHDTIYTTGKFTELLNTYHPDYTIIDADGIGGGVYDNMVNARQNVIAFHGGKVDGINTDRYKNWRTFGYLNLEKLVNEGLIRIKSKFIIDQLSEIRYRYDIVKRKYIIPKEELIEQARKNRTRFESPDDADALMMATSRVEMVKEEQAQIYTSRHGRDRSNGSQSYAYERDLI